MSIILICFLIILIIIFFISNYKKEQYLTYKNPLPISCHRRKAYNYKIYNYDNEILIPPVYKHEILGDVNNRKKYKFYNDTMLNKKMVEILNTIPKKILKANYREIYFPKKYNYYSKRNIGRKFTFKFISDLMDNGSKIIIDTIRNFLKKNYKIYHCNKIEDCDPKIIRTNLIKLEKNSNNNYKIKFSLEIHLYNKSFSYILVPIVEIINNKHYINSIELVGNRFQDKIDLLPGYESIINYVNIYSNPFQAIYNTKKTYYRDSDENKKIVLNDKLIKKILNKKEKLSEFVCIGKKSFNKNDCENDTTELNKISKKGVWDKKCSYHSECPFYQSNKNYPNRRGKCIKGTCEFPLGIKQLSFKKYDKKTKPLCYNCTKGYNCCADQLVKKYHKLDSPDYIFKDDYQERIKFKKIFSDKGMDII